MTLLQDHPLSIPMIVATVVLAFWLAGGLAIALIAAALAVIAMTAVERRASAVRLRLDD